MSFFEVETWVPKPGVQAEHDEMVRRWSAFVREHQPELFPEWKSARYFRQVDRYTGQPTGRFVMMFEYISHPAFLAYKERRKEWSGPYAAYKEVDPYQFFDLETVTEAYWEPNDVGVWLDFAGQGSLP
jgi:hypothetical protein